MVLQTVIHTLTTSPSSPYVDTNDLRLRATDKQIFNVTSKQVVGTIIWDRTEGILDVLLEKGLRTLVDQGFEEDWQEVHRDHPQYNSYQKYPHRIAFADLKDDQVYSKRADNPDSQGSCSASQGKGRGKGPGGEGRGR